MVFLLPEGFGAKKPALQLFTWSVLFCAMFMFDTVFWVSLIHAGTRAPALSRQAGSLKVEG